LLLGHEFFSVKDGEVEKMTDEQYKERAEVAWYILAECAQKKKVLTYDELAKFMNSRDRSRLRMNYRNCKFPLGYIQARCRIHLLPKLQSLVVNGTTRKPGKGYVGSTSLEELEKEHQRVFSHKWETVYSFKNWTGPKE